MSGIGKESLLLCRCWSPGHAGILKCAHPLGSINKTKPNFVFKVWNKNRNPNNRRWRMCSPLQQCKRMVCNTGSYSRKSAFVWNKIISPVRHCSYFHKGYKNFMNSNVIISTCMTIPSQSNLNISGPCFIVKLEESETHRQIKRHWKDPSLVISAALLPVFQDLRLWCLAKTNKCKNKVIVKTRKTDKSDVISQWQFNWQSERLSC